MGDATSSGRGGRSVPKAGKRPTRPWSGARRMPSARGYAWRHCPWSYPSRRDAPALLGYGLDIAVDNALLVGVLDCLADRPEQLQPPRWLEPVWQSPQA